MVTAVAATAVVSS